MGYIYTHTHTDREKPTAKERLNDFPKILRTESRVICITICGFPNVQQNWDWNLGNSVLL